MLGRLENASLGIILKWVSINLLQKRKKKEMFYFENIPTTVQCNNKRIWQ